MSCITDVILLTWSDDSGLDAVQSWLADNGHEPLADVSAVRRGCKVMSGCVLVGALNYLDTDGFVSRVRSAEWRYPDAVQLLVREEDFDKFREAVGGGLSDEETKKLIRPNEWLGVESARKMIDADRVSNRLDYVDVTPLSQRACLDGWFTADQLEAIAMLLRAGETIP